MLGKEKVFPPNSEVSDLKPSKFLLFIEKQKVVLKEYGFLLGVKLKTDAEKEGHRRYYRDWQKRYRETHREEQRARRHEYWVKVQKPGFESIHEARGGEKWLKAREDKKKRKEYDAQKAHIREKYGFDLNTPPKTAEEIAGRERYRKDREKEYRLKNRERIEERKKRQNAKRREENERRFEERMKILEATDPKAAAKERAKHEKLCMIQRMTHEERVRYRQQKLYEKLKAQAEREERIAKESEQRKLEKTRLAKERRQAHIESRVLRIKLTKAEARKRVFLLKRREREERVARWREEVARNAARREAELALEESYRLEREANIQRYLEMKRKNLERRSPDGDTQNLANTNVPTTPPLRDGYGTIGICQGSCQEEGVTNA